MATKTKRYLKAAEAVNTTTNFLCDNLRGSELQFYSCDAPTGHFRFQFDFSNTDQLLDDLESILGECRVIEHYSGLRNDKKLTFVSYSFLTPLIDDINNVEILNHRHDDYATITVTGTWY